MNSAASEWRAGWPLVLASTVGCGFAATHAVTLGTYIGPLTGEFGWTREAITAGLFFGAFGSIFLTPFLGRVLDRFGARRVALAGVPCYAFAHALFGFAGPSITSWYVVWGIMAILNMGVSPVAWSMAVASRFDKSRGLALAIVLAGMSVTTAVMPIITVMIIESYGWRVGYWATALIILVIAWPLTWALFYDARDLARGAKDAGTIAADPAPLPLPGLTLREALRSALFWRIAISLALVGGAYSAIYIHFQPLLTDAGIDPTQAALLAGIIGPLSFASRIITGFLLDRFSASLISAVAFSLPIVSCFLLRGFDGDPLIAGIAIGFTAIAAGTEIDLMAYLASRYFGMRSFGAVYGCIFSIFTILWATMPSLAGKIFDQSGSYDDALLLFAGMLTASVLLALTFGRYPDFETPAPG